MKAKIKASLLQHPWGRFVYARAQETYFERSYRARRERYERQMGPGANAADGAAAVLAARRRIAARGYSPTKRQWGDVHTFAFLPSHWSHQNQIADALARIGPLTRFDYEARGYRLAELRTAETGAIGKRDRMLEGMLDELRAAHRERPVDWLLGYALGWDFTASMLRRIEDELGIPTVNLSLDDKNWWEEIERGDSPSGLKNIAPHFDLGWTSARVVLPWYWAEGGRAMFLPEGVNPEWFRPVDVPQDIEVGFVGNNFGYRTEMVDQIRRAGIDIVAMGNNWPAGSLTDEEMLRFFSRSRINLGLGDMHFSRVLTNLKGRDFEVPSTGRGAYLTAYNAELATCFEIGAEILCYRGLDELIELLRFHRREPERSAEIARRGRERCLREHRWENRFQVLLEALGITPETEALAVALHRGGARWETAPSS